MDLQLAQEKEPYNYNYYNFQVIICIASLTIFIIVIVDYIQLKKVVNKETQEIFKILCELKQIDKKIFNLNVYSSQVENKVGNINKTINAALEQQLDYNNRQFITQNASIEEINLKLFRDSEESRAFVSRQISDIKSKFFERIEEIETALTHEIEELEEEQVILVNKIEERDGFLLNKIDEKVVLDKKIAYDMYRYLYFAGGVGEGFCEILQGFFKQFYGFEIELHMDTKINKMINDTHPAHIRRIQSNGM
jgi:hypothetical protein